ncbi:hypothetical protein M427DRAFT_130101 [Gonapodya prolifera JEL478]|uniref:P-loop containing nucleoside triphosphate hydrolase protein n=1 Tax=Gonapodya prolifera (strain JEL478) TaxID=1344416 RepID=A0A139B0B5_GONPJ|nr:hypothetical protein M427DRAFT_130101 [Gonapodya prolifera JEL478]|eukprot:KXS22414.1 hypothetical protein M427DRAFT_130101 [Gonapodya prolifera JEL478]
MKGLNRRNVAAGQDHSANSVDASEKAYSQRLTHTIRTSILLVACACAYLVVDHTSPSAVNTLSTGGSWWCGDDGETWGPIADSRRADLTLCFQKSVVQTVPKAFLLIFGLPQLFILASATRNSTPQIPAGWLLWTKVILLVGLLAFSLIEHGTKFLSGAPAPVDIFKVALDVTGFGFAIGLTILEHRDDRIKAAAGVKQRRTTGTGAVLLLAYLLWIISTGVFIRTEFLIAKSSNFAGFLFPVDLQRALVVFGGLVIVFILENFDIRTTARPHVAIDEERRPLLGNGNKETPLSSDSDDTAASPEEESTLWSYAFFFWLDPLMYIGFKRVLTADDLPKLKRTHHAETTVQTFHECWKRELARVGYVSKNGVGTTKTEPSILRAFGNAFGAKYFFGGLFLLFQNLANYSLPLLFGALLKFVSDSQNNDAEHQPPVEIGISIALGMFLMSILQAVMFHNYMMNSLDVGMFVRTATCSAVYQKSLVLSVAARIVSSTGQITNLMASDAQRIAQCVVHLHFLWSAPFQILVAFVLLYQQLGPSLFGGAFVLVAAMPMNLWSASVQERFSEEQMKLRDERIKIMDELLGAIKVIKLYAWEKLFIGRVEKVRDLEIALKRKIAGLMALLFLTWSTTPFVVALTAFSIYSVIETAPLTSSKIFVSLALFNMLNFPLSYLPVVISGVVQARVSLERLQTFLLSEEIDPESVKKLSAPLVSGPFEVPMVTVRDGTFSWSSTTPTSADQTSSPNGNSTTPESASEASTSTLKPTLSNVSFTVKSGECVAVVGRVGSGKSSLVGAVLGETRKMEGEVEVRGSVAYVSQVAWIMNATLRENVVFGNPWDPEWYNAVVNACALRSDFSILPGGDLTEIGERGINLSGGQRQRVNLARAVYQLADVYLLDDPLSAVDSHVGQHIFEEVIGRNGLLATKSRIFVTHGIHFLPDCDNILMVEDGKIIAQGKHQELLAQSPPVRESIAPGETWTYAELVRDLQSHEVQQAENEDSDEETADEATDLVTLDQVPETVEDLKEAPVARRRSSTASPLVTVRRKSSALLRLKAKEEQSAQDLEKMAKLIEKEELRSGGVSISTYMAYARACGFGNLTLFLVLVTCQQLMQVAQSLWLADWSNAGDKGQDSGGAKYRIGIYAALGLGQICFTVATQIAMMMLCSIRASLLLHKNMLENVMQTPQSFFDQTPLGRILNRFSKDIEVVDETIPMSVNGMTWDILQLFAAIAVNVAISPSFLLVVIPVITAYYYAGAFYLRAAREMQRLESASKSPIYAFFNETLGGLSVLRAFNRSDAFISRINGHINKNTTAWYHYIASNRWIGVRLEMIGSLFVLCASSSAVLAVVLRTDIPTSLIALAMSYALNMSDLLLMVVREACDVETNIVAVERIQEYSQIPSEAPHYWPDRTPPKSWPDKGEVDFRSFSTKYRPNLPVVLNGITNRIAPSEKCGLVGRTGSGKSSLALSLFRIIEATSGSIVIDGIDISTIGLHDLRSRITIIPQESLLFAGTMRENLDPFAERSDAECWRALEISGLSDAVKAMEGKLDAVIQPGGENISVGQRQLVCLARALLRRTKVLVLDEATASVDKQTDDFIQETIRKEFADCTIITIAHRIGTIMDYDRILVLGPKPPEPGGQILECDTPSRLLDDKAGAFYKFAKDAGLVGRPNGKTNVNGGAASA